MDKEQYKIVQSIFSKLHKLSPDKREAELNKLTENKDVKKEVLLLLENDSEKTILAGHSDSQLLKKKTPHKSRFIFNRLFTSTIIFRSVLLISLAIQLLIGIGTYHQVRKNLIDTRHAELKRTIASLDLSLQIWVNDYKHDVKTITGDNEVRLAAIEFLSSGENGEALISLLNSEIDSTRYAGFVLMNERAQVVLTSAGPNDAITLSEEQLGAFASVMSGETRFGPPLYLPGWENEDEPFFKKPNVWVSHTFKNDLGKAVGVLSVARPADGEFSNLFRVTQLGETGESYAVNQNGLMLTTSRLLSKQQIGLEEKNGHVKVYVKNPGVPIEKTLPDEKKELWPLTRSAQAIQSYALENRKAEGVIPTTYMDYRGEEVMGAWLWFPEFRFGIITEIDEEEAFFVLPYITVSFLLIGVILACLFVLSMFSTLRMVKLSEKAKQGKFGQYIIQKQIGEGGMSNVYLAGHELLQRPTALKVLKPEVLNAVSTARFKSEAQQISRLRNPHTIELYDYGISERGTLYYAMEYLDGLNLKELVKLNGPLTIHRGVYILLKICESLREAHNLNLVHRDIKPQNVMVCVLGGIYDMVKVLDFGLVKDLEKKPREELTQATDITGTPVYMAPERITASRSADHRSDIYALGALAYFLFTARPIFEYKNDLDVIFQIVNTIPTSPKEVSPDMPQVLSNLIMVCLEKKPEDRPENIKFIENILIQLAKEYSYTQEDAKTWWLRFQA